MRVPQISDRVKEAPAVALRGLLAGVGQLLLVTDKLRNKNAAEEDVPQARTPDPAETTTAEPAAEAAPEAAATPEAPPAKAEATAEAPEQPEIAAKPAARKRDFNKTGNVRLLTKEDDTEKPAVPPAAAEAAPTAAAEAPAAATPAETPAGGGPAALPNYDELSVASLRARLRNLTAAQVGELAAYEREHAARPEVIAMFERRIAKLEADG